MFGADRTDLLMLHRTTRALSLWEFRTELPGLFGHTATPLVELLPEGWRVVALADLDGADGLSPDGRRDIVLFHEQTGAIAAWAMDGATRLREIALDVPVPSDRAWRLQALADVDDDGFEDFIWHHATLGYVAWWKMDNKTFQGAWLLPVPPVTDPAWRLIVR
jgi:hypothetical protein